MDKYNFMIIFLYCCNIFYIKLENRIQKQSWHVIGKIIHRGFYTWQVVNSSWNQRTNTVLSSNSNKFANGFWRSVPTNQVLSACCHSCLRTAVLPEQGQLWKPQFIRSLFITNVSSNATLNFTHLKRLPLFNLLCVSS